VAGIAASARRNWHAVTGYSYLHRAFDDHSRLAWTELPLASARTSPPLLGEARPS